MMASFIPELIKAGASIIGGCCGTTPEHIRAMGRAMGKKA
jgi:methionine synthase I (cobalamin-dependent)